MRAYVSCLSIALVAVSIAPIAAEAVETADCVAVHDSTGVRVGRTSLGTSGSARVLFNHQGKLARLEMWPDELVGEAGLYFTGADCTGDAYMSRNGMQPFAHLVGTDVWYPDTTVAGAAVGSISERDADSGQCTNSIRALTEALPALNFTLPTYTPPFHLEPEACYTPPPVVAALTPYGLGAMAVVLAFGAYVMVRRPVSVPVFPHDT
jgi:hypothetical protein